MTWRGEVGKSGAEARPRQCNSLLRAVSLCLFFETGSHDHSLDRKSIQWRLSLLNVVSADVAISKPLNTYHKRICTPPSARLVRTPLLTKTTSDPYAGLPENKGWPRGFVPKGFIEDTNARSIQPCELELTPLIIGALRPICAVS